ncbi:MAG: SapC family protein [Beijerinckiaceae bacterium]|nr:SapC family protein [Beijerinckiaceae bacterium]
MTDVLFPKGRFVAVDSLEAPAWTPLSDYSGVQPIDVVPLADTELLNAAHYALLGVHVSRAYPAEPIVALLLHPDLTRAAPLDAGGKWVAPYTPLALRLLPFSPARNGSMLFCEAFAGPPETSTQRVKDPGGAHTPEFRNVVELGRLLAQGARRLSDAARVLLAADLLLPLEPLDSHPGERFLVINANALGALSPSRAAGLTTMGMLPLDLAAASLFSLRYRKRRIVQEPAAAQAPLDILARNPQDRLGSPLPDNLTQIYELDSSMLFSLDSFASPKDRAE